MFDSFVNSIKSVGYAGGEPQAIAQAAIALNRYKEKGSFLVQDSLIEERIAPLMENSASIDSLALFGFKDGLVLIIHAQVLGQLVETLLTIKPIGVIWKDSQHQMTFSYSLDRIDTLSIESKIAKTVLKKALKNLVPFGDVIASIAGYVLGQSIHTMGLAKIESWGGLEGHGITMKDGVVTIDLEKQESLAPLWEKFNVSDLPGGETLELFMDSPKNLPDSVASMIKPKGITANREGIHIQMELTPHARAIFEFTAGVLRGTQTVTQSLFG